MEADMNRIILGASLALLLSTASFSANAYETKVFANPNHLYIHDVSPAPGGLVYWTAQSDGFLGILDPKTGQSKLVKLGPDSAPHGVIQAKDGKAWITDGGQNAIVSYDPKSEQVKVYPLPADTGYTNLNTPTIGGDGNVWFTGQNGIHGKVDIATGKVSVWKSPKGRGSYGITTTPNGDVWFVSLANSYLGQIDQKTGNVKVVEPPVAGVGLRRVWSDSKGDLWMSEWNGGHLARYSPATNSWKRWAAPGTTGGKNAQIYAVYVDDTDTVWISNWTTNAVYSFDPKTEKFAEVPGSRPSSEVRQILGSSGVVWLPQSGNASIMRIDTSKPAS
jgi:virginiamycin B lyase